MSFSALSLAVMSLLRIAFKADTGTLNTPELYEHPGSNVAIATIGLLCRRADILSGVIEQTARHDDHGPMPTAIHFTLALPVQPPVPKWMLNPVVDPPLNSWAVMAVEDLASSSVATYTGAVVNV